MTSVNTIADALFALANTYPEKICFSQHQDSRTFEEIRTNATGIAVAIEEYGLTKASRVALLSKDNLRCYEVFFACALSQCVMVGINWRLKEDEIRYILEHSDSEIIFVSSEFYPIVSQLQNKLTRLKKIVLIDESAIPNVENKNVEIYDQWLVNNIKEVALKKYNGRQYNDQDALVQMYTSGTTGHPKGVELAHYSFFRLMQGMREVGDHWMDLNNKDTLLLSLPIFHIGGLWWAVQGFLAGAKGLVMPFFSGAEALRLMREEKVTKTALVPAMIQFVLAEPDCKKDDFANLKGLLYGASPISPTLLNKALDTFDCDFFQIYGMTETGNMAVCLRPEDHQPGKTYDHSRATGRALPGVELKVIDINGIEKTAGEIGEVLIKSPSRMLAYWKNPEETARTMCDDWIYTGDAGYLDGQGYLTICDRIKDMIIYAGENIYPAEIEAVLNAHPQIREVAVIGVPDERWGELVKAIIVLPPETTLKKRQVLDFLKGKIADYKLPKLIEFIEALPRNAAGKVLKRDLRDEHWREQERQVN